MQFLTDLMTTGGAAYTSYNQNQAATKLSDAQKKEAAAKNNLTATLQKFAPWLIGVVVLGIGFVLFRKK